MRTLFHNFVFALSIVFIVLFTAMTYELHVYNSKQHISERHSQYLNLAAATPVVTGGTNSSLSLPDSTTDQTLAVATPKKYEYKTVTNVDECTLNHLGNDGWLAVQFGNAITAITHSGANCSYLSNTSNIVFDWILFQR